MVSGSWMFILSLACDVVNIAVHFTKTSFISSRSIAILIKCADTIKSCGGEFLIIGGGLGLEEYFKTSGIQQKLLRCESISDISSLAIQSQKVIL